MCSSDLIALGLADHFVPSESLADLAVALRTRAAADAVVAVASAPPASALLDQRYWIDDCYDSDDAAEIVARLAASPVEAARHAASAILAKSPTAVSVTLESLRRARVLGTLEEVLDQEFRVSVRFLRGTELVEGVRAQVIDKDRTPHWSPPTLDGVTRPDVEAYFASLGGSELGLQGPGFRGPEFQERGLSSTTGASDRRSS